MDEDEYVWMACSRGCGSTLRVAKTEVGQALTAGRMDFSHDICPTNLPKFRSRILIERCLPQQNEHGEIEDGPWEELVKNGATIEAVNFETAYPLLSDRLTKQWDRVAELVAVVDSE